MTDKAPDTEPENVDPRDAKSNRPPTEATVNKASARGKTPARRSQYEMGTINGSGSAVGPFAIAAITGISSVAVGSYAKAFAETLAKHNAGALIKFVRTRKRGKDENAEVLIGLDDYAGAALIVPSDAPDEAWLALLDLDVTADELRGKVLRWDGEAQAWRPE